MTALPRLAALALLLALAGCVAVWEDTALVAMPPASVPPPEPEWRGPWVTGDGEKVIWTDRI